jgi:hypothetical protein
MIRAQDALSFDDADERFRSEATELTTTPCSHNSSLDVGTGFIGGEDQGYIACP